MDPAGRAGHTDGAGSASRLVPARQVPGWAASFLVGAGILLLGHVLLPNPPVLTWATPVGVTLEVAALVAVAVLACTDVALRRDGRSLPLAMAAIGTAVVWIPHLVTFPGVIPVAFSAQASIIAFHVAHIATPLLLAATLFVSVGPLRRPHLVVVVAMSATLAVTVAVGLLGVLVAPLLPAALQGTTYTAANRVYQALAVAPVLVMAVAYAWHRRGSVHERAVGVALGFLVVEALAQFSLDHRYTGLWYAAIALRPLPAFALLAGQVAVYRMSVRDEMERTRQSLTLVQAGRELAASLDVDTILSATARAATELVTSADGPPSRAVILRIEGRRATLLAVHDPVEQWPTGESWDLADIPAIATVARTGTPLAGRLPPPPRGWHEGTAVRPARIRCGAWLPIRREGAVWAVLAVTTPAETGFADRHVQQLTSLMTLAGLALGNAFAHREYRLLADNAMDIVSRYDTSGVCTYVSPSVRAVLGYEPAECLGKRYSAFVDPRDVALVDAAAVAIVKGRNDVATATHRSQRRDGQLIWLEVVMRARRDPQTGALREVQAAHRDVTARRQVEITLEERNQELAALAIRDPLTGLPNRREFERLVSARPRRPFAILAIDIDGLKAVNDEHGHEAGDVLLRSASATLGAAMRHGDVLARVGGDEFVAILDDVDVETAVAVAERMRVSLHSVQISAGAPRVSIGCVAAPAGADAHALWRAADGALYLAKRTGRDRVVSPHHADTLGTNAAAPAAATGQRERGAREEPVPRMSQVVDWAAVVTALLNGSEPLAMTYDPIVRLADGAVLGVQAVPRVAGLGGPATARALAWAAAALGRSRDLDWVLQNAGLAQRPGSIPGVFVTTSSAMLVDPLHAVDQMLLLCRWARRPASSVVLELSCLQDFGDAARLPGVVAEYRRHGFRFCVPAAGVAGLGVECVIGLAPEFVKISPSALAEVAGRGGRALVAALVAAAGVTGATVIAEGLDSPDLLAAAREVGITAGQGAAVEDGVLTSAIA